MKTYHNSWIQYQKCLFGGMMENMFDIDQGLSLWIIIGLLIPLINIIIISGVALKMLVIAS